MTSETVKQLVEAEIGDNWQLTNAHGVDLKRCLVTPVKKAYIVGNNQELESLWLVLEEDPTTHKGYEIVYDEEANMFGLATTNAADKRAFLVGLYGTFKETLHGM